MKKLMIAAAIVCAAVASQASSVNWGSGMATPYFFDTTALAGNDSYSAGGSKMQALGGFAYTLDVTGVDSASGTVAFSPVGPFMNNGIIIGDTGAIAQGQTYSYTITITKSLSDKGTIGGWDYSDAIATTTLSGTFTGATGSSILTSGTPTTWTVTGAVAVPEPTSGLLLLLGVAGMALRRRRA